MRMLACLLLFLLSCGEPDSQQVYDNGGIGEEVQDTTTMDEDTVSENTDPVSDDSITFLALGDSYTIGESVPEQERWPVQLRNMLHDDLSLPVKSPRIIARTGWTTDELQKAINDAAIDGQTFDMVSLLIGVNNQYRGYPLDQYREEFPQLLNQAIEFAGGNAARVFVVSIPDYGVTPFGENQDSEKIGAEIDLYNDIARDFSERLEVRYFDITPISRKAAEDPDLVAGDGLHPSGKMYKEWVELIFPWVAEILDQ